MRLKQLDSLLRALVLLGVLVAPCGSAWAASGSCSYAGPGAGIGDTGMGGTGTGGTGDVADEGTGTGGTGIRLGVYITEMQVVGNVTVSQGTVEARSNGRTRTLAKGDSVCVGETIMTAKSASVQIMMVDEGLISLRPQTQLKIEKFVYSGTSKDKSLLNLLKGACRIVTGKIGKQYPQNVVIKTPTAIIGDRGADHEAAVILQGDREGYLSGTYDKVNSGATFIRTEMGEVEIHSNQAGFAAGAGEQPTLLPEIPGFYNNSLP